MERLTTDKNVSDMSMCELAHNCCYIGKSGSARYRDYDTDIDARVFVRKLLIKYAGGDDAFESDDDFDEEMLYLLQCGTNSLEGLIALFYRNLWAMAELREKLKAYEYAEEQGTLLRLRCKVGDEAYHVIEDRLAKPPIYISEHTIKDVSARAIFFADDWWTFEEMDELNAFLTKAEAEEALRRMKGGIK